MQYVKFGNTGMKVSRFCLGAMTFGGHLRSGLDEQASARVVDEALDHGVNFIDTADSYGDSEETLGRILPPEKRERVYLATKVFRCFCRDNRVARNSRVNIINSLERSLRLMKTDYVDLYQLHHPDPDTPADETLSTLDMLVKQGKIRYVGVSNHYAWQMAYMLGLCKAAGWEPLVSVQSNYGLLDRQVEREIVPFCEKFNIAMMCYSPLARGVLTGKYHKGESSEEISEASKRLTEQYVVDPDVAEVVAELRAVAEENGVAMNQAAILWLMSRPRATAVILGGSKPEHFTQIYEIADRELPEEAIARLDKVAGNRIYQPFRNQSMIGGPGVARIG
ncbi:MAG: aldo/keto reductase [Candidatus Hydrogenedentes bacterium]|nr:aldo/keto reductase [Candidatus Hydrogenedentota bacterium]